jgi:nucleotide-binding universal stress UspA family protein
MLKRILVCLEGSLSSEAATRMSIELALTCGARLAGLAVIDDPDIRAGMVTGIGGASFKHARDQTLMADARKHADDWVALFERRCREAGVLARGLEIVGRPADSILDEMVSHDLTVIGKDANFRFETEVDDVRTREAILRRATGPVLLVPESAAAKLGRVVIVAYDGSGAAKRALTSFANSGLASSREIHVATVDDSGAQAWEMADRAVQMLASAGIPAKPHNVVSLLSNVDALFELAAKLGAGLMVMGSFAHRRLRDMFFSGSVTHDLVEKSTIPLYMQH